MRVRLQNPIDLRLCCECGNSLKFHWPIRFVKPLTPEQVAANKELGTYFQFVSATMLGPESLFSKNALMFIPPATTEATAVINYPGMEAHSVTDDA